MMRLPKFEYHVPQTMAEAVKTMGRVAGRFKYGRADQGEC